MLGLDDEGESFLGKTKNLVKDLLCEIGFDDELMQCPVNQLSGGYRMRLGLACALVTKPDILLLDEVLSVGDSSFKKKSKAKIKEMVRSEMTVMIISHDLNTLKDLCDRLIYIENGRIIVDDDDELVVKLYQME